ncbi:MAG TPA: RNB domain-containing ribonuclease [Solirubrobacteraceae bacterium]|nr:RNB domain-containing ribonuclease [Solirubrobacteraceae bacterium]
MSPAAPRGAPVGAGAAAGAETRTGPRVALLARHGKFLVAEGFFAPGPRQVVSRDSRYGPGDLVLLGDPVRGGRAAQRRGAGGRVRVLRRLGRPEVARDVIEALMLDRGLAGGFEAPVAREARAASESVEALADGGRRDLRALPTFTIDPTSARDYDDAISAEADGDGGWRVWVHIADVAAYVPPRSHVDREAYRRGTSVYVPGAVEPMLPGELSNGACSLVPGDARATVTVEMAIGPGGVRSASMYRSLIRSDERLDYDRVDRIFAGAQTAQEPWGAPLAAARAAAAALGELRSERSALVVESAEPEFVFDRAGDVVDVGLSVQTESHRLIEALMIAANEQVARVLADRGVPALYRVHERPDPPAVERLVEQLASLGVPTPAGVGGDGVMTPQQAAEIAGEASALVAGWVARRGGRGARALSSLVLRALKQAHYDDRNLGHAGLASSGYCHFTSPIRRYPDLICHRALLSIIAGEAAPDRAWVHAAGPWTSQRERAAMTIERDADDVARCFLLERWLLQAGGGREEVFSGEVVGLIGAGAFVAFGEDGRFEGMLPVRRMRGDWWELNEAGTMLVGARDGGVIRLGDTVEVRVGRIDAPRGRVDLLPAADPE